jgi:hypothetical protein
MVHVASGVSNTSAKILTFQIREIGQDFFGTGTASKHVENIFDANPHPANAGASATLSGINCDSFNSAHNVILGQKWNSVKDEGGLKKAEGRIIKLQL